MPLILEGCYLPLEKRGEGGFGATFLALDLHSPKKRQCVVKLLRLKDNLDPSQIEKVKRSFRREAEVLETLGEQHRQIPTLYAYFDLTVPLFSGMQVSQPLSNNPSEFLYLVQEYVDGQDLAEELEQKENGRFSEDEVLEILQQILPVLQFVHNNGAIHRDIKPANIMRHRDGRLYLLDFGAVKQVTEGVDPQQSSIVFATPGFAPLEQMSGKRVYPSTDLYALAVTCLCLLGGEKQPNENVWDRWRSWVSDRLGTVLDRMLLPNPNQRFQSAEEVLAALDDPVASPIATEGNSSDPPTPYGIQSADSQVGGTSPDRSAVPRHNPPSVPLPKASRARFSSLSSDPPTPYGIQSADSQVGGTSPDRSAVLRHNPQSVPLPKASRARFSTLELLGRAAFTGFEGGLLAIALASLLGTTLINPGVWLLVLPGLIFAQYRRLINKSALPIIAIVTLGVVLFVPSLQAAIAGGPISVLLLASLAGLLAFTFVALSQLIYNLLSSRF